MSIFLRREVTMYDIFLVLRLSLKVSRHGHVRTVTSLKVIVVLVKLHRLLHSHWHRLLRKRSLICLMMLLVLSKTIIWVLSVSAAFLAATLSMTLAPMMMLFSVVAVVILAVSLLW